ncbi:hypothetical protein ACFCV3_02555 [Kribbella sp. NPDC056345]|uniref:hypothetical protein n=1 Tax=Kribbella sp. NPDC056345 TaxID=3345789 RepID=UPI0035D801E6
MTIRRLLQWAPMVLVVVLAAGCSASKADTQAQTGKAPDIATLETPTPGKGGSTTKATPKDPDAGRVRERIDMTDADRQRLLQPYLQCMKDNGIDVLAKRKEAAVLGSGPVTDPKKAKNAGKVCEPKLPLPAWEVDANNPDAMEFGRKVVQCLKDKGVKYVELSKDTSSGIVGPSLGGKNNDMQSITKGMDLMPECQREVAGK